MINKISVLKTAVFSELKKKRKRDNTKKQTNNQNKEINECINESNKKTTSNGEKN